MQLEMTRDLWKIILLHSKLESTDCYSRHFISAAWTGCLDGAYLFYMLFFITNLMRTKHSLLRSQINDSQRTQNQKKNNREKDRQDTDQRHGVSEG
jgi:hypothetical protein